MNALYTHPDHVMPLSIGTPLSVSNCQFPAFTRPHISMEASTHRMTRLERSIACCVSSTTRSLRPSCSATSSRRRRGAMHLAKPIHMHLQRPPPFSRRTRLHAECVRRSPRHLERARHISQRLLVLGLRLLLPLRAALLRAPVHYQSKASASLVRVLSRLILSSPSSSHPRKDERTASATI